MLWPATIEGIDVWAYRWPTAPLHVLEIISATHLRGELGLTDRDSVSISMNDEFILSPSSRELFTWAVFWFGRGSAYYYSDRYEEFVRRFEKRAGTLQGHKA